jgi:hypothetical protein
MRRQGGDGGDEAIADSLGVMAVGNSSENDTVAATSQIESVATTA